MSTPEGRQSCLRCGSERLVSHPEVGQLSIAHIDCDSFYASVEKRDNPELRDKPVLVGGSKRGVVMAACYVAREYGVHSAMPMFKALRACPDAVIIPPDMKKYVRSGAEIRDMMRTATPLVEPISIDEAFLDLGGTERLHGGPPAQTLAALAMEIERKHSLTVSIGLSHNKFLAKIASGLDKPRGFKVIGKMETVDLLSRLPVSRIWGVGKVTQRRLAEQGVTTVGQLQAVPEAELVRCFGKLGQRLSQLAMGRDSRTVSPDTVRKSLSSETTFTSDLSNLDELKRVMWRLAERVAAESRQKAIGGRTITLKLKTSRFHLVTRSRTLSHPTQLSEVIYTTLLPLLAREADGTRFRLLGVGLSEIADADVCDPIDLANPGLQRQQQLEGAVDSLRNRFGKDVIGKGRSLD